MSKGANIERINASLVVLHYKAIILSGFYIHDVAFRAGCSLPIAVIRSASIAASVIGLKRQDRRHVIYTIRLSVLCSLSHHILFILSSCICDSCCINSAAMKVRGTAAVVNVGS